MGSQGDGGTSGAEPRPRPANARAPGGHPKHEHLWSEVLGLAGYVESVLRTAIAALCEGRTDLVAQVRTEEAEIDRWEVRIEQACLRALALYDLVASDLRRVVASLRINRELERLADIAESLAKRARKLGRDPVSREFLPRICQLAQATLDVVDGSLQALRTLDSQRARLLLTDRKADRRRGAIVAELKQKIRDDPDHVGTWLRLISSARNLERAADHATHIAAAVVYVQEGVLLHKGEQPEEE